MNIKFTKMRGKKYMLDLEGGIIEVGRKVAFNYSGMIKTGMIKEIKAGKVERWYPDNELYYWKIKPKIFISWGDNKTSVVTNPHNLIVLNGFYDRTEFEDTENEM